VRRPFGRPQPEPWVRAVVARLCRWSSLGGWFLKSFSRSGPRCSAASSSPAPRRGPVRIGRRARGGWLRRVAFVRVVVVISKAVSVVRRAGGDRARAPRPGTVRCRTPRLLFRRSPPQRKYVSARHSGTQRLPSAISRSDSRRTSANDIWESSGAGTSLTSDQRTPRQPAHPVAARNIDRELGLETGLWSSGGGSSSGSRRVAMAASGDLSIYGAASVVSGCGALSARSWRGELIWALRRIAGASTSR